MSIGEAVSCKEMILREKEYNDHYHELFAGLLWI